MTRPNFRAMIVLGVAGAVLQFAQARQPKQDEPIKLRGELVVLDAQVLHKKTGLPVRNLSKDGFVLHEDGIRQHISHFSQDQVPLSVIILIDVSGSVWPDLKSFERLRSGARDAMNLLKPEDEVTLMQFAEKATLIQPFTRDRDLVLNALSRLDGRKQRGTYVAEGILHTAKYMRSASNPDSRRAIIAITDDVTIALTNRAYTTPTTYAEGEALHELHESGAVLCTLLYEGVEPAAFRADEPLRTAETTVPRPKRGVAKQFAEATGGVIIKTSQEDLPTRLSEMIERLRQRYTIAYSSSNTSHDGKFRKIKLSVTPEVEKREGGVAVITRKGYYGK